MFCTLTEAQLRNRIEPDKGIFIVESPKVIIRALDAGYEPLAILCEYKHITGDASDIIKRCENVPVYTGNRELLATLTGYVLTRGVLCAMRRPAIRSMEEVCWEARRIVVIDGVVDATNIGAIFRSAAALGIVVQSGYRWGQFSLFHGLGWTVPLGIWVNWGSARLPWHSRIILFPLIIMLWLLSPN